MSNLEFSLSHTYQPSVEFKGPQGINQFTDYNSPASQHNPNNYSDGFGGFQPETEYASVSANNSNMYVIPPVNSLSHQLYLDNRQALNHFHQEGHGIRVQNPHEAHFEPQGQLFSPSVDLSQYCL